jgi:hypothetical protein
MQLDQNIDSEFGTVEHKLGEINNMFDSIMVML